MVRVASFRGLALASFGALLVSSPAIGQEQEGSTLDDLIACIDQEVAPYIGEQTLGLVLSQLGLAEKPADFGELAEERTDICVARHTIHNRSRYQLGRYVAAVAVRDEARNRLQEQNYDLSGADAVLSAYTVDMEVSAKDQTATVFRTLVSSNQLGFDPAQADNKLLLVLVGSYISSTISVDLERYELVRD